MNCWAVEIPDDTDKGEFAKDSYVYIQPQKYNRNSPTLEERLNQKRDDNVKDFIDVMKTVKESPDIMDKIEYNEVMVLYITLNGTKKAQLVQLRIKPSFLVSGIIKEISESKIGVFGGLEGSVDFDYSKCGAFEVYKPEYIAEKDKLLCATRMDVDDQGIWALPFARYPSQPGSFYDVYLAVMVYNPCCQIELGPRPGRWSLWGK